MTKYAQIWGAGTGDTLRSFYWDGQYAALEELGSDDTCDIFLPALNPYNYEFFSWHPAREKLNIVQLPYFTPDQDEEMRRKYGVPQDGSYTPLPRSTKPVVFYPSPEDEAVFDDRLLEDQHPFDSPPYENYIVHACGAGTPDRSIPSMVQKKIRCVTEEIPWHFDVSVGRSFERGGGRWEPDMKVDLDLVDDLSLPGVCKLVQGATGVVCCHSMVSMLCWLEKIPQLLLYPQEVLERHFRSVDMWSWGANAGHCVHGTFDEFSVRGDEMISEFLTMMKAGEK